MLDYLSGIITRVNNMFYICPRVCAARLPVAWQRQSDEDVAFAFLQSAQAVSNEMLLTLMKQTRYHLIADVLMCFFFLKLCT